jgi:hypothetical protein
MEIGYHSTLRILSDHVVTHIFFGRKESFRELDYRQQWVRQAGRLRTTPNTGTGEYIV